MINKKSTRLEVLKAVKEDGYALSKANITFRDDYEIVLASVSWNSESIKYASERLKDNRKIAIKAIQADSRNFKYASERIRMNDKIAIDAIFSYGLNLKFSSMKLKKNYTVVKNAYQNAGLDVLKYTTKEIKMKILEEDYLEELAWNKKVKDREIKEKFIEETNAKSLLTWIKKNKQFLKTKETISKLINGNELNKVLKKNFLENKKNNINNLPLVSKLYIEGLKNSIFKLLIPEAVNADYFEDKIIKDKLYIYDGYDAVDLLFFSNFQCEPIADFTLRDCKIAVSGLFYFSLEIKKNSKYLIKAYLHRENIRDIFVIKQSYRENDKSIINFILKDALKIDDENPPWDQVIFNKNIFLNFENKEKNKFKKIWQQTFKDHNPKSNKKPLQAYWNRTSIGEWTDIMDNYFLRSAKLIRKLNKNLDDDDVYSKIQSIRVWISESPLFEPSNK